jgi:PAS domain S-box-containing protein
MDDDTLGPQRAASGAASGAGRASGAASEGLLDLDSIPAFVTTANGAGEIEFANRSLLAFFGVTLAELKQHWRRVVHADDLDAVIARWARSLATGEPYEGEHRGLRADGVYRWLHSRSLPVRDGEGTIVRWLNVLIDVEDRKRAEADARRHELDFRLAIDSLPGLLCTNTPDGAVESVNETLLRYTGQPLESLRNWQTVVHPDDLPQVAARWAHSVATGEPFDTDVRVRNADGDYRWFHCRGHASRDAQGRTLRWYNLLSDIHERKQLEEKLRRSEAYLLEVQRLSKAGGWRYDVATNKVEPSAEILRSYGVAPGQDTTEPAFWFDSIHRDERERVTEAFRRCERDKTLYRADYRVVRADGELIYHQAVGRPILDDAGNLVEYVGASMDITEHWLAKLELERTSEALRTLQAKLAQAARIAAVGELAAAIAHEVNQPLAAVVANAHACLRWLAAEPPNVERALDLARRIVRDGKDAGEVVRRIRALFKRDAANKTALDMNELIEQVLSLLEAERRRKRVALEAVLERELPPIVGDPVQLQQLVLNLLLNALEATDGVAHKQLVVRSALSGDRVLVEVQDSGAGVSDPEKVFEPFFTTKANGLGMGLSICRSIVELHRGRLWCAASSGQGTTFCFELPLEPA